MYNSDDELIDDHYANEDGDITDERREEILNEHDPYEDGYIGSETIHLLIDDDGSVMLDPSFSHSIHGGQ